MNPMNMKKIPRRIDRDFNTIDVIFVNFQTLYVFLYFIKENFFNFRKFEQNSKLSCFKYTVFSSLFSFSFLNSTWPKKSSLNHPFLQQQQFTKKRITVSLLNANRTKQCKHLCLHLYNIPEINQRNLLGNL